MTNGDRDLENLARYLQQHSTEDEEQARYLQQHDLAEALVTRREREVVDIQRQRIMELEAVIAEIVTFTKWAKDTDLEDDWLTELRRPQKITARMVWAIARKAGVSE